MVCIPVVLLRNLQIFYLLFSFRGFVVLACTFMSVIQEARIEILLFSPKLLSGCCSVIHWKDFLFLMEWFWHLCWKSLDFLSEGKVLDRLLCSFDLSVYPSTNTMYLDYYSLIIDNPEAFTFVLFSFKIALTILNLLLFHKNFRISLSTSTRKPIGILIVIALKL